MTLLARSLSFSLMTLVVITAGCSDDDVTKGSGGTSGSGATGGAGGSAGTGATAGGGTGGAAGAGGSGGVTPVNCEGTATSDPTFSKAMTALKAALSSSNVPGGAVALVRDGKLAHVGVAGSKRSAFCDPITENTLFRSGLITSVITSMAALSLKESGKVSLTEPITKVVPTFSVASGDANGVTLATLLTQTSAFPAFALDAFPCTNLGNAIESTSVPLWATPGTMFFWDPSNYQLAGWIVETVHGKPFAAAAQDLVLGPLGMGGTFEPSAAVKMDYSFAHQVNFEQAITSVDCGYRHPSDQYHASITDLGKLAAALLDGAGTVLSPGATADMLTPQGVAFHAKDFSAYGFDGHDFGNGTVAVWRGGVSAGFSAEMILFPAQKFGVITLLNGAKGDPVAVNDAAINAEIKPTPVWPSKTYQASAADLSSAVGTYEDNLGFKGLSKRTLEITQVGNKLFAAVNGSAPVELFPVWARDSFELTVSNSTLEMRFWRDPSDAIYAAAMSTQGGPPFYRVTP